MFLCEYLHSKEIHEGLNVVENWTSANDFTCYGKGSEIQKNQPEEQEIAILCLHLLQNCLLFIIENLICAEGRGLDRQNDT
ncbi:hypothetical protein C0971_14635 [Bacillus methanolicus]|nr:hypothetical protein C0971_14635 [Bacillus methanolicus]